MSESATPPVGFLLSTHDVAISDIRALALGVTTVQISYHLVLAASRCLCSVCDVAPTSSSLGTTRDNTAGVC